MAELGQTHDPKELVPGEPSAVDDAEQSLRSESRRLEAVGDDLKRIHVPSWTGAASAAFSEAFRREPPAWFRLTDEFLGAADTMRNYGGALRQAQSEAGRAIALWDEAEQATTRSLAQHVAAVAHVAASVPAGLVAPAAAAPAPFGDAGEPLRAEARDLLERARAQLHGDGDVAAGALAALPTLGGPVPGDAPGVSGGDPFVPGAPTPPHFAFDDDFPYDPDATPTWADRASWAKWNAMLRGGQLVRPGLDDATQAYAHYLDGSGKPLRIDYEEAYREDRNIRSAVDSQIGSARESAERIARDGGGTHFSMTGDPYAVKDGEYPDTENWQKTLGAHQVWSSADVTVEGNRATMTVTVHAADRYNFNRGAADIETGAPDNENGRFSELGWAKGFDVSGEVTRTVSWTVGDPGPAEQQGSGSPEFNVGREDREDGRDSSGVDRDHVGSDRDTGKPRAQ